MTAKSATHVAPRPRSLFYLYSSAQRSSVSDSEMSPKSPREDIYSIQSFAGRGKELSVVAAEIKWPPTDVREIYKAEHRRLTSTETGKSRRVDLPEAACIHMCGNCGRRLVTYADIGLKRCRLTSGSIPSRTHMAMLLSSSVGSKKQTLADGERKLWVINRDMKNCLASPRLQDVSR